MIFKPSINANLWDTWLFYYQDQHYLFYLANSRSDVAWDGIGLALSKDGVHFTDQGLIVKKADDAVWLGSGMTWRMDSRFMLSFSEVRGERQEILLAESTDLLHWQRLPYDDYVCRHDPRWYSASSPYSEQRWDAMWVLPRDDAPGYIGFITAIAASGPPGLRGTAACALSRDGLHFEPAPPVLQPGTWGDKTEVGAVEKIGERYYMLLGVLDMPLGARGMARLPAGEGGMFVVSAAEQQGPYTLQPGQEPLLVGSPTLYTYFARFYRCGDEVLLNHHTAGRTGGPVPFNAGPHVAFAPLKTVVQDQAGLLSLGWWAGNEALKGAQQPLALEGCHLHGLQPGDCRLESTSLQLASPSGGLAVLPVKYNTARGVVLEAEVTLTAQDGPLSGAGLFIEGPHPNGGTLLLAEIPAGLLVGPYFGYGFHPEDQKPLALAAGQTARWRLLLRDTYLELYVDDRLIQCYVLQHPAGGRLGFAVEAGTITVSNAALWEMSL